VPLFKLKKYALLKFILIAGLVCSLNVYGQTAPYRSVNFGSGANQYSMDFVDIGYAGNAGFTHTNQNGRTTTRGGVNYDYSIGKYEVTSSQYERSFTNANSIWSGSQPAGRLNFLSAAAFANFLTSGDGQKGVYKFDPFGEPVSIDRAAALMTYGTIYAIPTDDEWYKAAFFKADGSGYSTYTTGERKPVEGVDAKYNFAGATQYPWDVGSGTEENNGTYDMFGNVGEWLEDEVDGDPAWRGTAGGSYGSYEPITKFDNSGRYLTSTGSLYLGFRVVSLTLVPEPTSTALLALGGLAVMMRRRR